MKIEFAGNSTFKILKDEKIVGFGNVDQDDFPHVESIEILNKYRNHGYNTQALFELQKIVGDYTIAQDNPDAARLYNRLFDEVDQERYSKYGFAIDCGFGVFTTV